ncbi:MAG: carboxylating nicotinate-nucleotide diphosphorylase [Bacteroidota bacterium]|nr:carboxylating nicotinate-nucleotide diphosphorylase [Bacteroidota bacterium]MDX5428264.1 carboxylating nicotinate-nucleotide diphosphorylase [Bacteroidota bacterium]MDX5447370.1 carboxylating nicotinate-nucleotide diphosphorylase [Bacteroidota bacterium]MDX5506045.1 carboxylating nicotinate-nucleotide diphosphorylase [Bacteroidota bacterium]
MDTSTFPFLETLIEIALAEDIGDGDHSARAVTPKDNHGKAQLLVKEPGILAGIPLAVKIFEKVDPSLKVSLFKKDGDRVVPGDIAFLVEGPSISILSAERTVLNFMQRLSGVATVTRRYADIISGTKARVLDTRKTTPGWRHLEKYAVRVGGGMNHRMGLYDMIMLKDNHIDLCGGMEKALKKTHEYLQNLGKDLPIEIEVRDLDELKECLKLTGFQRIMLDNFTPEDTHYAVELIHGRFEIESSGGITDRNILDYAEAGVDFISVGALTHSVKSLDLSLKAIG